MVKKRYERKKPHHQGVRSVVGGNLYRGFKTSLVVGFNINFSKELVLKRVLLNRESVTSC